MSASVRTYAQLVELLTRDQVSFQADPPNQSVHIPTRARGADGVLVIRWQEAEGMAQLVHPLPITLTPRRLSAVEAAIARVNHALILPGFGINHEANLIYYRIALPVPNEGVPDHAIQGLFSAAVRTAADFGPSLRRVAEEDAPGDGILADASVDLAFSASGLPMA